MMLGQDLRSAVLSFLGGQFLGFCQIKFVCINIIISDPVLDMDTIHGIY